MLTIIAEIRVHAGPEHKTKVIQAFEDPEQFFHGVGVDGVYLPFHKANQFLGMQTLDTFIANDVIKQPNVPFYEDQYRDHLTKVFA